MKWMAKNVKHGSVVIYPNVRHCSMWDDQEHYFPALILFIKAVDKGEPSEPVMHV